MADHLFTLVVGIYGLLIGSFLNVVIWRVPQGLSVVRPASACPGCGQSIRALDNIPLVSWLLLRGKCRGCRAPISARYPAVELATGLLFAATTWWLGPVWHLPAFLYLAAIAIALTMIDIDVLRLPDAIVLPSYLVAAVLLGGAAIIEGLGTGRLLQIAIGGAMLWAFYGVIWFAYPKGMGRGDVKLAGVLGMYLGWFGWKALVVGSFAAFLIGGVVGLLLLMLSDKGRKARIPYGPYMLVGAYVGLWLGLPVASWYLQLAQLN